jgi:DNA-binding MarR family transcriptional regulator
MQQSGAKELRRGFLQMRCSGSWVALGRVSQGVQCEVENGAEGRRSFPGTVLVHGACGSWSGRATPIRPKDLAIPLFILPYQLSRLVDRMEKEGLVKRIAVQGRQARPPAGADSPRGSRCARRCGRSTRPRWIEALKRINDKEALKLAELLNKLGGIEHVDCGDKG